jgi:hypothetical protein
MSRLEKYKKSINSFISERSEVSIKNTTQQNQDQHEIIRKRIIASDKIVSVFLLTIMNNQNKKKHITVQGYYSAITIELINELSKMSHEILYGSNCMKSYQQTANSIMMCSYQSLNNNIENIKSNRQVIDFNSLSTIFKNIADTFNGLIHTDNFESHKKMSSKLINSRKDIVDWYLKDEPEFVKLYNTITPMKQSSYREYMNKKYVSIYSLALKLGWVIGLGDNNQLNKLTIAGEHLAYLYKMSNDIKNIKQDLKKTFVQNGKTRSLNYCLNYGLQKCYDQFINRKEKFITEMLNTNVYTTTINEIIFSIDEEVTDILNNMSPDIKSICSSSQT